MSREKLVLAWRVGWPLVAWFFASAVVLWFLDTHYDMSSDPDASGLDPSFLQSAGMLIGWFVTSLIVARRYKRLVARPLSITLKICVYFLLALGILLLLGCLLQIAFMIAAPYIETAVTAPGT